MHFTFNDIAGYAVYYLLFVFTFLLVLAGILKWVEDKWVLVITGFVFILIAALRARGIDKDYENYLFSFNSLGKPTDYFTHYSKWVSYEPISYLLPSFVKLFFRNGIYQQIVFFIYSISSITILFTALKKVSPLPAVSVFHFFCYYFLVHEMTQIRVAVACALLIWGAWFYFNKQYKAFAAVCVLAPLFHYAGMMMPFLLLFKRDTFSAKRCFIFLGLSLALVAIKPENIIAFFMGVNTPFLQKMNATIEVLSSQSDSISIFNVTNLLNIVMAVWLIINHKKLIELSPYAYLFIKMQVLSIFLFGLFSSVPYVAFRISEFWGIVNIITATYIVYAFRSRIEGYLAVTLYSFFLLVVSLHVSGLLQPYRFVFMDK